jgi:hypothetical protein
MTPKKKSWVVFLSITALLFLAAALVFYFLVIYFPTSSILSPDNFPTTNDKFATSMYPQLLDIGKFFLTILVGVFVASITFSEKIVNFATSAWWSKSLLIFCWIFLLISIVSDGVGLVFLTDWYSVEMIEHDPKNIGLFGLSFFCYAFAGISFGIALTSMLAAGIISAINEINFKRVANATQNG